LIARDVSKNALIALLDKEGGKQNNEGVGIYQKKRKQPNRYEISTSRYNGGVRKERSSELFRQAYR